MIIDEIKDFYKVTPLKLFRKTKGVIFDLVPNNLITKTASVDRVLHENNAISPGSINDTERPWYMHEHQEDNLLVLHGYREVELYSYKLKKKVVFKVYPDKIFIDGKLLFNEGVILTWGTFVFHRIISGEEGSASLNFAVRSEKFDVETNFNIYSLSEEFNTYKTIRKGSKDQF